MKLLLDENLPKSLAKEFQDGGLRAFHVAEIGLRGAPDIEIASYAKKNKMILVTKDLEFGSLILYPKGTHYGLIILRLPYSKADEISKSIKNFLASINQDDLIGKVTILELGRYRAREF